MGEIFDAIRERVTAREAAEAYGMTFGRNGRALCPWHDDHRPDLTFYGDHCVCHACHRGGDAVALVAQLFGLSMIEAARKVNSDFRLGLDAEAPTRPAGPSLAELRKAQLERDRLQWGTLCDVVREADERLQTFADGDAWDNPVFLKTLEARSRADLMLDNMWWREKEVWEGP